MTAMADPLISGGLPSFANVGIAIQQAQWATLAELLKPGALLTAQVGEPLGNNTWQVVGMFSDKAILKLGDVFNALFQPADTRSNKLQGLSIALSSLPDATVAAKYGPHQLAKGGTPPYKWTVDPALPAGLSLGGDGVLTGTPTAVIPATTFKFKVTDSVGATNNKDLSLTVK